MFKNNLKNTSHINITYRDIKYYFINYVNRYLDKDLGDSFYYVEGDDYDDYICKIWKKVYVPRDIFKKDFRKKLICKHHDVCVDSFIHIFCYKPKEDFYNKIRVEVMLSTGSKTHWNCNDVLFDRKNIYTNDLSFSLRVAGKMATKFSNFKSDCFDLDLISKMSKTKIFYGGTKNGLE